MKPRTVKRVLIEKKKREFDVEDTAKDVERRKNRRKTGSEEREMAPVKDLREWILVRRLYTQTSHHPGCRTIPDSSNHICKTQQVLRLQDPDTHITSNCHFVRPFNSHDIAHSSSIMETMKTNIRSQRPTPPSYKDRKPVSYHTAFLAQEAEELSDADLFSFCTKTCALLPRIQTQAQ